MRKENDIQRGVRTLNIDKAFYYFILSKRAPKAWSVELVMPPVQIGIQ